MAYKVSLTKDTERDLEEIYFDIDEHDSRGSANHVLDRLLRRIHGEQVVVYVIADGRRYGISSNTPLLGA